MINNIELFPTPEKEKETPFGRDPLLNKLKEAGVSPELIKEVEERLKDGLTGLPKAETAQKIIEDLVKEGRKINIEFNDIRYLKIYNETIGHEKTNEMLREIGRVYQEEVEKLQNEGVKILIARYAGDEFLIIVADKNPEEAEKYFDQIDRALRNIRKQKQAEVPFGFHFSRGKASLEELPPEERNFSNLIALADKRALEAKRKAHARLVERAKRKPPKKYKLTRKLVERIKRYPI